MIYVVIDTNVLVSAMIKWSSIPGSILEFALTGVITPVLNEKIIEEYRTVLSREKFHMSQDIVEDVIQTLIEQGEFIKPDVKSVKLPDSKDVIFYEVVMEKRKSNNSYLVTGNIKHFPKERFVVTPREMLEIVLNSRN